MEQNQQQPSQQTPSVAAAPPPVQPVQPVEPLPPQQELQSAIDLDRRRQRIKTARVLCAIAALLNLIGAVATATLYALTANNHVVTLIVATLLPVVASFFGLSAVGKSRVASSISFFGISIAAVWYFLFGIVILFSPLDSRPDWLMTLLLILDMIALIGGIIVFIMGILSGIFCALAKRIGKRKGIVQLVFVCVILAAAIGVTVYALGFEAYEQEVSDNSIIWETAPVSDNPLLDQSYDGEFTYEQVEQLRNDVQSGMTYQQVCDALNGNIGHIDGVTSTEERTTVYWVDSKSSFVMANFTDGKTYSIYTVTDLAEDLYENFGQEETPSATTYSIGDTWTVDGQWSLTITGVRETTERNQFSDKTPGAVYIIDYTYTNLGYEGSIMDLYISLDMETIVDSAGVMGYSYPNSVSSHPQQTPIGATCNAQACIGVDNPGAFTLTVRDYDSYGQQQTATFNLSPQ